MSGPTVDELMAKLADVTNERDDLTEEVESLQFSADELSQTVRDLEEELETAGGEWVAPLRDWHNATHPGPLAFCDEQPCADIRRITGVR